jgi:hypothetical protein
MNNTDCTKREALDLLDKTKTLLSAVAGLSEAHGGECHADNNQPYGMATLANLAQDNLERVRKLLERRPGKNGAGKTAKAKTK